MQVRSLRTPALLACVVLCAAHFCSAEDDPKSVAVMFAKAIQAGDKSAAHEHSVGSPEKVKIVDNMMDAISGMMKFKEACDKKFGADNILSKNMAGGMPDLSAEAGKADYKVEGDVATASDKSKPDEKNPMKLKKVDGKWKVDLESMGNDVPDMGPILKVFNEATEEINAGKYKTVEEAAIAIGTKMQAQQK